MDVSIFQRNIGKGNECLLEKVKSSSKVAGR